MKVLPGDDIRVIMQWRRAALARWPGTVRRHFTLDAQRFGLHIWVGIGLDRLSRPGLTGEGSAPEGHGYEHRGIHRQRSEVERRGSVHEGYAAISAMRFLRPGRADPRPCRRRL